MVKHTIQSIILVYSSLFMLTCMAAGLPEFGSIIEKNVHSVVNITTEKEKKQQLVPDDLRGQLESTPLMDVLKELYGPKLEEHLSGNITGIGSGSIISSNGYIVTNYHVIKDAKSVYVRLHDTREYQAQMVGYDLGTDIALLKIEADNLPFVEFASNDDTKVGQWVLAIGSPFGFESTATAGIISAKGRSLLSERYVPFIQTDVAINPGNSGGPLFNMSGQMIGVNSQIMTESGSFAGISFAIPVHVVKSVVEQIKAKGVVKRGWMGLAFQDVTRELAQSFQLKEVRGALVSKVVKGSPADKAGVQIGDIIVRFNQHDVIYATDLPPLVGVLPIHSKVVLQVLRNNTVTDLNMELGDMNERLSVRQVQYRGAKVPNNLQENAVKVRNLEEFEQKALASNQGVYVLGVMSANWQRSGIRKGDVILAVGDKEVDDPDNFYKLINKHSGKTVPLLITRIGEIQRFVAVKID